MQEDDTLCSKMRRDDELIISWEYMVVFKDQVYDICGLSVQRRTSCAGRR